MKVPSLFAVTLAVFAASPAAAKGPCRPSSTATAISTSVTTGTQSSASSTTVQTSASLSSTAATSTSAVTSPTSSSVSSTSSPATTSSSTLTTLVTSTSSSTSSSSSTTTTTTTTSSGPIPTQYILVDSGHQQYYISLNPINGAVVLTTDSTAATPFYTDAQGQVRNLALPNARFVDKYIPNPATANDQVFFTTPDSTNYAITCNSVPATNAPSGSYFGGCSATSPDGNPVVYGWGNCPAESTALFMIPNSSNVHCVNDGYAFLGFFTRPYVG